MSYDYERMWREDSVLTSVGYTWTNTPWHMNGDGGEESS